jgi:hypothetical protein
MLKRHISQRTVLATIPVSVGVLSTQHIPAFPAQHFRGWITEQFFSGRIPLHNDTTPVNRECGITSLVIDRLFNHSLPAVINSKALDYPVMSALRTMESGN